MKKWNKSKKPIGSSQDWSQKNPLAKIIHFYKSDILSKDPEIAKKKSEKYKFTNIFTRFVQHGQLLQKGFQQNSIN